MNFPQLFGVVALMRRTVLEIGSQRITGGLWGNAYMEFARYFNL